MSVVTVSILDPSDNELIDAVNYTVIAQAISDTATITSVTIVVGGGTPLAMNLDSSTGNYTRLVATPPGFTSILVTATDSAAASATDVAYISNGPLGTSPPAVGILQPAINQVFAVSSVGVSADVISGLGIDPSTVQMSVDKGATWLTMTPPPTDFSES